MPDRYMDVKDYTETVSVRLTKAQVERVKHYAKECGMSVSDVIRRWIDDLDVLPMIPAELKSIIRQKTDAATRGKKIANVLDLHFNSWLT